MLALQWALGWLGKKRRVLIAAICTGICSIGLMTVEPFLFKRIIDEVIMGGQYGELPPLLAAALGFAAASLAFRYATSLLAESASQHVVVEMRAGLFERILRQTAAFHRENKAGDLITLCTGDIDIVRHFVCWVIPRSADCAVMVLTVLTLFITINPLYALCLFVLTPVSAVLAYKMGKAIRPAHARVREQRARLSTVVNENISGNRVIRAFAREPYEIKRFEVENNGFREAQSEANRTWLKYQPFIEFMAQALGVVNLIFGAVLVVQNQITLGEMNIFQSLAWALNEPMLSIGTIVNDGQRFAASADKLMRLQYCYNAIQPPEKPVPCEKLAGDIELRNVGVAAEGVTVLDGISLKIAQGQTIGLMGPTGSGKSVLAGLIPRMIDATSGEVLVDGVNVKEYDLRGLRRQIGMTAQDVFLFSDTVESNVAYSRPDAPMEAVIAAADTADADGFVQKLPLGYETIVGERGTGLSGGQKQRLSLARALLSDPAVLILDDTTSAVDMETERKIQAKLAAMETRATRIVIAQRVTSVKDADWIFVLENGKIAEQGTHEALMENKGYYYKTSLLQNAAQ